MIVPLSPLDFQRRSASLYGSKVGIVDRDRRFTYGQFDERVARLANVVRDLGILPGDRVAYLAYNSHQLLEAYYGVVAAGAVLAPLNIRLSEQELTYILDHMEARLLFLDPDFAPLVKTMLPKLHQIKQCVLLEDATEPGFAALAYESLLAQASPVRHELDVDENAVCELFYTSGSTGRPKGVAITHRSLYLHAMNCLVDSRTCDEDVLLHVVPLFHVNGWGSPHTVTGVGGTHVILRKFAPADVCRLIERERVTQLLGVPTMLSAIVNCAEVSRHDLSSLHSVLIGGSAPSPALIRHIERVFPACRAFTGYGLTETTPVLTSARPKSHVARLETDEQRIARQATTGRPLLGVELRVVTPELRDVPADEQAVGEIVVRSNVVMDGYFKDPDATVGAMRGGWFHTEDMAVVNAEGYVTIVDRKKDIIISGGENISSIEVEKALAEHPAVLECAVVAVPDDRWGEAPLAFVVLRADLQATGAELNDHCRTLLAGFKAPKEFVFADALPKGGTGKVLKNQLREPYWAGYAKRVH